VLENVKNLQSHDKGKTFAIIKETLDGLGYTIDVKVIDGQHFVPQHRERVIIVGFRESNDYSFEHVALPQKGHVTMSSVLHRTDGSEPYLDHDGDRFFIIEMHCGSRSHCPTNCGTICRNTRKHKPKKWFG
jgi:DNA (cytosine-5)-methyltransferase 1